MTSIQDLGARIARNSALIDQWLSNKHAGVPSFEDRGGGIFLSTTGVDEIETARLAVVNDTMAIHDLLIGPGEVLRRICWGVSNRDDVLLQRIQSS